MPRNTGAIEHRRAVVQGNGITRFTNGDARVVLSSISDRFPQPGRAATFTVRAYNTPGSIPGTRSVERDNTQFEVQVEISLSPGLDFATRQAPERYNSATRMWEPSGTFNSNTGIWDVGTLEATDITRFPVAVDVTDESLAELPLEERCLTAKVVRAVPRFGTNRRKRQNETFTACLGGGGC